MCAQGVPVLQRFFVIKVLTPHNAPSVLNGSARFAKNVKCVIDVSKVFLIICAYKEPKAFVHFFCVFL